MKTGAELFAFVARVNREFVMYNISLKEEYKNTNVILSTRSQGDSKKHRTAPFIFKWCFQWKDVHYKHDLSFQIWYDDAWRLRCEHDTENLNAIDNRLMGDCIFEYQFDTIFEMIKKEQETLLEFKKEFKEIITM